MKRDLKKYLQLKSYESVCHPGTEDDSCGPKHMGDAEFEEFLDGMIEEHGLLKTVEFMWCAGQKQFLKDILDDIDDGIEKIFGGKDQVKNDKARIVAEESNLKAWLYGKYKYLQRKNGKTSV